MSTLHCMRPHAAEGLQQALKSASYKKEVGGLGSREQGEQEARGKVSAAVPPSGLTFRAASNDVLLTCVCMPAVRRSSLWQQVEGQ